MRPADGVTDRKECTWWTIKYEESADGHVIMISIYMVKISINIVVYS
jgi:hypothetical protein